MRQFLLAAFVMFVLGGGRASAETGFGDIEGTIIDAGSRPAARAQITFTHQGDGEEHHVVADSGGKYKATRLPAGSYTVTVRDTKLQVMVADGQSVDLKIRLSDGDRVLPLRGRNYLDLVRNASDSTAGEEGGNIEGYTPYSLAGNGSVNAVGQRGQTNNFLIDGIDNNEPWLGSSVIRPSVEAIQSAELDSVNLPSSIGHTTGGSIDVQTRRGSNQFHGSAFEYLQSSTPNARNFFDGSSNARLTQNQFGGNSGGPLGSSPAGREFFYFVNADVSRERRDLTVISTVPTALEKIGDFGSASIFDPNSLQRLSAQDFSRNPFPGNQIPLTTISTAARNLAALYPDPNLPGLVNNYRFNPLTSQDHEQFDGRIDKSLSPRSRLFGRVSYEDISQISPGAMPAPVGSSFAFSGSDPVQHADDARSATHAWNGGISHSFTFGPGLLNQFHVGVTRYDLKTSALGNGLDASTLLGIPGLGSEGLPTVTATGYTQLGASEAAPLSIRTGDIEVSDSVSWKLGAHSIQLGVEMDHRTATGDASAWTRRGTFSFTPDFTSFPGSYETGDAFASMLTGYPSEVRRDVQFSPYQLRAWELAGYVEDGFRIHKRLRIDLGIRYSFDPPLTEASDRIVNFDFGTDAPALARFAGRAGVNGYGALSYNKRAMSPRLSIAWDMTGRGNTVLRAAFSKLYDPGNYLATGILARNPPFASRLDIVNSTLQTGPNITAGLPAAVPAVVTDLTDLNNAGGAVYVIEPNSYTPYADNWGVYLEHRLRTRLALEAGLISSMGIHLLNLYDSNQPIPAPTPFTQRRYPFQPFTSRVEYLNFAGGSTYYGGQLKLTGTIAKLNMQVLYRYGKSLDDSTQPFTDQTSRPAGPQFIYFPRGVRSPSPFDVTQRLTVMMSHDLPFKNRFGRNWTLATVTTFQTGMPFTPQLALNGLNNGGFQLPNIVGNGALSSSQRSVLQWFNTSLNPADPNHAFQTPAPFQYGDSGYDILRGPGLANVDASVARSFVLREALRLQMRVEAFNLLNHTNLGLPNRILGVPSSGSIDHTSTPSRQLQFVARLEW